MHAENKDWATGPPGRRAFGPSRAVRLRAAGPSGRRAAGPLGRRGPWAVGRWAAGLLLAKPLAMNLIAVVVVVVFFLLQGMMDM